MRNRTASSAILVFAGFILAAVAGYALAADPPVPGTAQILKHSWTAIETNQRFGRVRYAWVATVMNQAEEARKVCVNYALLNAEGRSVVTHEACSVVAAGREEEIGAQAYLDAKLLPSITDSRAALVERGVSLPFSFKISGAPPPPKPLPSAAPPSIPPAGDSRPQSVIKDGDNVVLSHTWRAAERQEKFGSIRVIWTAAVRNAADEARKACVNYELLDTSDSVIVRNQRCQVLLPGEEREIEGDAYIPSKIFKTIKTGRAIPGESHRLYSFVRPPAK